MEKGKLERELEISRQHITVSQSENEEFREQLAEAKRQLVELENSRDESEQLELFTQLEELQTQLTDIESFAVQRTEDLGAQLKGLAESKERLGSIEETNWFPVLASAYSEEDLEYGLKKLESKSLEYEIHVYETKDRRGVTVYAITLGGYLSKPEASNRVRYAKSEGLSGDAYTWSSDRWGDNLLEEWK